MVQQQQTFHVYICVYLKGTEISRYQYLSHTSVKKRKGSPLTTKKLDLGSRDLYGQKPCGIQPEIKLEIGVNSAKELT